MLDGLKLKPGHAAYCPIVEHANWQNRCGGLKEMPVSQSRSLGYGRDGQAERRLSEDLKQIETLVLCSR